MKVRIVDPTTDEPVVTFDFDQKNGSAIILNGFTGSSERAITAEETEMFVYFVNVDNFVVSSLPVRDPHLPDDPDWPNLPDEQVNPLPA